MKKVKNDEKNKNNEESIELISNSLLQSEEDNKKVVFVFGAGASISSGVPGGRFLKDKLEEFFKNLKETEKIIRAYQKLPDKLKYKDIDNTIREAPLEYLITFGCNAFGEKAMIDWLRQYIPDIYKDKIKYFPPIAYEFVSHLMTNKLIQYVVTLNYDELLEKTIDDELGEGKCKRIVTLEDFEKFGSEDRPEAIINFFIIKPHGTISLPKSLRHRYEQTLEFEEEKADALRKLFRNKILVLVGYEANDEDFRLILSEQLLMGNIEKIIIVKEQPDSVIKRLPTKHVLGYNGRNHFFTELAGKLYTDERYKNYYTKATRHFIRCEIYKKLSAGDPEDKEYESNRKKLKQIIEKDPVFFTRLNLLLEILIFCFKSRGLFANTALINCPRIISALKEHLKVNGNTEGEKTKIKDILESLVAHDDILKKKETEQKIGICWYYLPNNFNKESIEEMYKKSAEKVLKMLDKEYLKKIKKQFTEEELKELRDYLYELQQDFDYDLGEDFIPYFLFYNPQLIKSRKELSIKTEEIFKPISRNNCSLYFITLTGEWLRDKKFKGFKEICIITDKEIEIEDSIHYKNVCSFRQRYNRASIKTKKCEFKRVTPHITLQFKEEKGEITKGKAIYFFRPGKSTAFAPFYLENIDDIKILKKFFENLWPKSISC